METAREPGAPQKWSRKSEISMMQFLVTSDLRLLASDLYFPIHSLTSISILTVGGDSQPPPTAAIRYLYLIPLRTKMTFL